jgi:CheY-like chemotaxis protein
VAAPIADRRALVVDDEPSIRGFLALALEDAGYAVETASDGVVALHVLDQWRPDVILLDLMMPHMDGWSFRSEQLARPELASIPVVVLSAALDGQIRTRELRPAAALPKPVPLEDLLTVVESVTGQDAQPILSAV